MSATRKPSVALYATSVSVIVAALVLVSASLAAMAATWDPCSIASGIILLPLPFALAVQQYRGTFRHVRSASRAAGTLLFVVGSFTALMFVTALVETAGNAPLGLLASTLAIANFCFLAGWLNRRWSKSLTLARETSRFTMRELLAATAAVCFMTALVTGFIRSTPPKYAEHVSVTDAPFGLPRQATDISFCQGSRGTIAFEFSIDRDSFRNWVNSGIGSIESDSSDTKLKPITGPTSILRYHSLSPELNGPDSISVTSGLHYSWSYEDRGVYAVFDSTTNRAYYFAHFH